MTDECSPTATMRDLEWLEKLMRAEIQCAKEVVQGEIAAAKGEATIYNQQVDKALGVADQIANARNLARMWVVGVVVTVISLAIGAVGLFLRNA